jgi:hypothetical protein
METQKHCLVSYKHLLQMAALTQKTVDQSVKGYELNCLENAGQSLAARKKLAAIERNIADRGRTLSAAGTLMDTTSQAGSCSLRIYSALRTTHAAASEMARITRLKLTNGHLSRSAATTGMAHLVNGMVRLNTVALFSRRSHHAKTVLQIEDRRKRDLWRYQVPEGPQELAISRCLELIAEQAHDIADSFTQLLESRRASNRPSRSEGPHVYRLLPEASAACEAVTPDCFPQR